MPTFEMDFREKLVANIRSQAKGTKRKGIVKARPQAIIVEEKQKATAEDVYKLRKEYAKLLNE
ncbi:hypothetical protein [Bacillus thuringiensis]|uniref:hypothetical protein n=1 Tax=Bacillus thuringiensis TaxID=1428 RepID=UPI000BFA2063|nr:hypothetical protein [Bacillus thuringiensis]PFJ14100.1 hypothetical protein COI87_03100 [Bacillus thuringiensis]HDR8042528.1 hypothetical protein [Bacillus cereus]